MDKEARLPYVRLAEEEKARYEHEKAEYAKHLMQFIKKKRAPSAYALYIKENFKYAEGAKLPDKSKYLAAQWKALSDEEKLPYQLQSQALKDVLPAPADAEDPSFDGGI